MEVPCEFIYDNNTYKCIIQNFEITTEIEKFHGDHSQGLDYKNVMMVCFENCKLSIFPRNLAKIFPRLIIIEISHSGLKEICKDDLRGYKNLILLSIIHNELKSLPNDLFEFTPNIQFLDFSANQITTIGPTIFDSIKNVSEIVIRKNKNIDEAYYESQDYAGIESYEKFMKIIRTQCRPLESLQTLAATKLTETMNELNAVEIFICSCQYDIPGLKRKSFRYLKDKMMPWLDERSFYEPKKMIAVLGKRMIRKERYGKGRKFKKFQS